MKITHCISTIDKSSGGPARSVTNLIEETGKINSISQVKLLSLKSDNPLISKFLTPKLHLKFFSSLLFGYSKELNRDLQSIQTSLFHGHGLWQPTVHQMASIARKRGIPYLISVRGMLEPWSMQQSKFTKKIAMQLYQYNDLKEATCLHATAQMEVESIRELGFKNPIALISNGINISEYPLKKYEKQYSSKRKILFLSRIHPKKGIEILIAAWESVDFELKKNWHIEIVGNGDNDYISNLNKLILNKGLENQIKIVGPKFGKEKLVLYHSADLFVLPTYSENFGIVVAESLSCGVPVITTKGAPWEDLEKNKCGWWIDKGEKPLKFALVDALKIQPKHLQKMGENGRKLVEEKYSINAVARQMLELYEWVLEKGEKPEFVNIF